MMNTWAALILVAALLPCQGFLQVPKSGCTGSTRKHCPACAVRSNTRPGRDTATVVHLRPAKAADMGIIQRTLAGMLMNPLFLDVDNFVCAEERGELIGFGQIRTIGQDEFELASLYVKESHRKQGLGRSLVRHLLENFVDVHTPSKLNGLYLLTLASTTAFYSNLGFEEVPADDAPATLRAELIVGSAVQALFGNSLACMRAVPR